MGLAWFVWGYFFEIIAFDYSFVDLGCDCCVGIRINESRRLFSKLDPLKEEFCR
jgi:hypothetical protein